MGSVEYTMGMAGYLLLLLVPALVSGSNLGEKSSKKGLVIPSWPRHFCYDWNAFTTVSWWYHYHTYEDPVDISPWWCTYPSGARPSGEARQDCFPSDPEISFIPQVYGIPGYGHHANTTDPDVAPEHDVILGWNEPNQADQANIPPDVAALAWIEHQEKYADKILVAPAMGHADTEWFDAFYAACEQLGCRFDYLAAHYYTATPQELMVILQDFSERYGGRKLWLTEFAVAKEHDEEKIVQFIHQLIPMLEEADFIWRYSWFYTRYYPEYDDSNPWFWIDPVNSLLEQEHPRLTEVGKAYNYAHHLHLGQGNQTYYEN